MILAEAKSIAPQFADHYNMCKQLPLAALLTRHSTADDGEILQDQWDFTQSINSTTTPWAHYLKINLTEFVSLLKCITNMDSY